MRAAFSNMSLRGSSSLASHAALRARGGAALAAVGRIGSQLAAAQCAARLNVSLTQLWRLCGNAAFPRPGARPAGVDSSTWSDADVTEFAATLASARANSWIIPDTLLPTPRPR
jgi:predicted DNA-binding transcriptional regulator AlpA